MDCTIIKKSFQDSNEAIWPSLFCKIRGKKSPLKPNDNIYKLPWLSTSLFSLTPDSMISSENSLQLLLRDEGNIWVGFLLFLFCFSKCPLFFGSKVSDKVYFHSVQIG